MSKEFDVNKDKSYDPNSSEFYLSEKQIKDALANIENDSDETKAVKSLIKKIETIHRNKCQGDIKASEASSQIKELNKEFSDKFNKWPFQTKAFEKFYAQFGSKELSSEMFDNIGENNMKLNHTKQSVSVISEEEFINALQDMTNTENDIFAMIEDMNELEFSFECYRDILKCVKEEGGVSQSLEMLFGSNFSSSEEMTTVASLEEEGFFSKVIQWVKDFFAKIWAWFKSWFQTRDGMIKNLEELKAKADTLEYPVIAPNYLSAFLKAKIGTNLISGMNSLANDVLPEAMVNLGAVNEDNPESVASKASSKEISNRYEQKWEMIKAKLSFSGIKEAQGNQKLNKDEFIRMIDWIISGLQESKQLSDAYSALNKKYEDILKAGNASFAWLRAKEYTIYIWKENQKYFRALLRIGNLLLQRAKEGSGKATAAAAVKETAEKKNNPAPSAKEENNGEFKHGAYWEKQDGVWTPVAEGDLATEALRLENEFLRDELEFNQLTHEMELLETVIDCIKKEGGVSDSLQNMFGENWTSKESALEELEAALEGFINDQFNKFLDDTKTDAIIKSFKEKFTALKKLIDEKGENITFPIKFDLNIKPDLGDNLLQILKDASKALNDGNPKEAYEILKKAAETFPSEGWNDSVGCTIETLEKLKSVFEQANAAEAKLPEFLKTCDDIKKTFEEKYIDLDIASTNGLHITRAHINRVIGFTKRLIIRSMMRAVSQVDKIIRSGNTERDKSNDLHFGK